MLNRQRRYYTGMALFLQETSPRLWSEHSENGGHASSTSDERKKHRTIEPSHFCSSHTAYGVWAIATDLLVRQLAKLSFQAKSVNAGANDEYTVRMLFSPVISLLFLQRQQGTRSMLCEPLDPVGTGLPAKASVRPGSATDTCAELPMDESQMAQGHPYQSVNFRSFSLRYRR